MCLSLCEQFSGEWSTESAMKTVNGEKRIPVNVKMTLVRCVHVNTAVCVTVCGDDKRLPQQLTLVNSCPVSKMLSEADGWPRI